MTPTEAITALEKALEAGPTPGPWNQDHFEPGMVCAPCLVQRGCAPVAAVDTGTVARQANAAFIAAANPLAIRTLLDAHAGALRDAAQLREALQGFLEMYVQSVNSGDWGNWNPEDEDEVIAARAALATNT